MQLWQHPEYGTWYVLHGHRLKQRVSTRATDRKAAEIFLAQFIASQDSISPDAPTVGAILEAYRTDALQRVRSKQTLRFSVDVLLRHFRDLQPHHLTPSAIRKFAKDREAAPGTILREVGVLRAALAWAVEHQWITTQPVISNPVKTPLPRNRWITKDEARRLLAACVEPHVKTFVMLGLMTAARMGAILEAKWSQVDFDRKVIDFGPGHGNKRRGVAPINPELERTLTAAKELSCTDYVVEWRGEPVKTVKNGFKKACKRAGLQDVSPHILRHSAATWMAIDGVPLSEIARLLGDQQATVERVYAKHNPDYLRRATSALRLDAEAA